MKDGIIQTSSRGGQDYNIAAHYIIHDPFVEYVLKNNPNYILDGELYIHGKPLSYISGLCRLETLDDRHKDLTFQCYDIVREDLPFNQRLNILHSIEHNRPIDSKLEIVFHSEVQGKDNIIALHNRYVDLGYEGLVIRDPEQTYKCGARDKRMLKIKMFQDGEFKIVGITDGLREEDFVFNMETKEGYPFEAKPMGDRALKK
jgi:DNA ligase-1